MNSSTAANQSRAKRGVGEGLLTSTIVELVCLIMFASRIDLNSLLHSLDSAAKEVDVAHRGEVAGLRARVVLCGECA